MVTTRSSESEAQPVHSALGGAKKDRPAQSTRGTNPRLLAAPASPATRRPAEPEQHSLQTRAHARSTTLTLRCFILNKHDKDKPNQPLARHSRAVHPAGERNVR